MKINCFEIKDTFQSIFFLFQLQELTSSPYVFLIPLFPSSEEGLIQVVGDRKLDKEIRFSVSYKIRKYNTRNSEFYETECFYIGKHKNRT